MSEPERFHLRSRVASLLLVAAGVAVLAASLAAVAATAYQRASADAQHLGRAARRAAALGGYAREQYLQETHAVLLRDATHVAAHDEYARRFDQVAHELLADVDDDGARRLRRAMAVSREIARVFSAEIVPAIERHDDDAMHLSHHVAARLVDEMTTESDRVADTLAVRAEASEARAISVGRRLLAGTLGGSLALLVLGGFLSRRLWRDVARPLESLSEVAARVSRGERDARVGRLDAAELDEVGAALDGMLDTLARTEEKAVAAERLAAVGSIAAGVAHEINNPIAVIRGYAQSMIRDVDASSPLRDELAILDEEAAVCQRIAEDLSTYARAPSLRCAAVSILSVATDSADRERAAAGESAPPAEVDVEDATLSLDAVRMRQVVVNLLRNARQATEGGVVRVVGRSSASGYTLRVEDDGPGIPPEQRARIFEPFFTTRRDGSGLGLAVCFGIVTAHGGTIAAEARGGKGTSMVIVLPVGGA